jgi:hypothetical protein
MITILQHMNHADADLTGILSDYCFVLEVLESINCQCRSGLHAPKRAGVTFCSCAGDNARARGSPARCRCWVDGVPAGGFVSNSNLVCEGIA